MARRLFAFSFGFPRAPETHRRLSFGENSLRLEFLERVGIAAWLARYGQ